MSQQRSWLGIFLAVIGSVLSLLFLANPGWGLLFEIPDTIPIIGNMDEVLASAIFFSCMSYLGINLVPDWRDRRRALSQVIDAPRVGATTSVSADAQRRI